MKKNYSIQKTEKVLRDLIASRHALAYLNSVQGASLSLKKEEIAKKRILYLSRTIEALEHAVGLLDPIEQKIIRELYFDEDGSVEEICETCALERSSVYRYRARAIEKLAVALYGE